MRIRILHVPDCPNVAVLQQRLDDLLADGQFDVQVVREIVDSEDAAVAAGMAGSPTLLVDGFDPFADGEPAPSVSCRLYRDESGRRDRAPSTAQLRRALQLDPPPSPPKQIDSRPPAADCCCSSINFYVNRRTAQAWAAGHPTIDAAILDCTDAEKLARRIFGSLLRG